MLKHVKLFYFRFLQVHLQTPSFPWQQELVTFPYTDVSCSVAWIVLGILCLFPRGIRHHVDRKTGKALDFFSVLIIEFKNELSSSKSTNVNPFINGPFSCSRYRAGTSAQSRLGIPALASFAC